MEGESVLGVNFWKIQRGWGVIGKIPSVGGRYGYFLELHNIQNFEILRNILTEIVVLFFLDVKDTIVLC